MLLMLLKLFDPFPSGPDKDVGDDIGEEAEAVPDMHGKPPLTPLPSPTLPPLWL